MTQILSIPFAKRSQVSHKERSTAKPCNETLQVPDIERWNKKTMFSKCPYFSRDYFLRFWRNNGIVTSSLPEYNPFYYSFTMKYKTKIKLDLSDTNKQRGRQTRPKHHTNKDHKSKLKTRPEKLLHISEVTGCCFQGLEDSKGFINGITSAIILLDTFAVTLHEGCRLSSLIHEHDECD